MMHLPEIGDVFEERFRIDGRIGEGGFARVYAATELETGQTVALKVLKPDVHGYDDALRRRFDREVLALAKLQSPHTIQLLSHGSSPDGLLYAVFEYVAGRELAAVLNERGRLEPGEVEHVLRQLLDSLDEAHRHGVLHRDLKPENVIVFREGSDDLRIKLLDFGIARPLDDGSPSVTKTGELIGTPRYMSPEQLTAKPLTPASDLYSLGLVTLEMAVGRDALHGGAWGDQLDRLRSGHVFSIPELDRVGARLHRVIARLSQRDPPDRFQAASQVRAALDAAEPRFRAESKRNLRPLVLWLLAAIVLIGVVWSVVSPSPDTHATIASMYAPPKVEEDGQSGPPAPVMDAVAGRFGARPGLVVVRKDGSWQLGRATGESVVFADWGTSDEPMGSVLVGDFDGDKFDDVAVRKASEAVWLVGISGGESVAFTTWGALPDSKSNDPSSALQHVVGDFNDDGRDDIATFDPSNVTWSITSSTGVEFEDPVFRTPFGTKVDWGPAVVGDFDGDDIDGIAHLHTSGGRWWVFGREGREKLWGEAGRSENAPALVADFTGDGRADVVDVDSESEMDVWRVLRSTGSGFESSDWASVEHMASTQSWVGDVDGDGRPDIIIRERRHRWWVLFNRNDQFHRELWTADRSRSASARHVVADLTGDGQTDVAYSDDGERWKLLPQLQTKLSPPQTARLSGGCGRDVGFAVGKATKIQHGPNKKYSAYVPTTSAPDRPIPLVVLMHDGWMDPHEFLIKSGFLDLSELHEFAVIAPHAPVRKDRLGGEPRDRPWQSGILGTNTDGIANTRESITDFLGKACVDLRDLFLVGHGRGANAVEELSCDENITAMAMFAHIGDGPRKRCDEGRKNAWRPIPTLRIHPRDSQRHVLWGGTGCEGQTIEPVLPKVDQAWEKAYLCPKLSRPYAKTGNDCRKWVCGNGALEACLLDGGHTWPRFEPRTKTTGDPGGCDGPAPDYDIAGKMWEFLARQRKSSPTRSETPE